MVLERETASLGGHGRPQSWRVPARPSRLGVTTRPPAAGDLPRRGGALRCTAGCPDHPLHAGVAAQGVVPGSGVALLSLNRPEVLFAIGAYMVSGCRNTPLHPLGSLDDHAYVLEDAGIETLVFDPSFAERAEELPGACTRCEADPVVRTVNERRRPVCTGGDVDAHPLVAPSVHPEDISALSYTGGTTGAPKGVIDHLPGQQHHGPDHVGRVAVARRVATPRVHAAEPRRVIARRSGPGPRRVGHRPPRFDATRVLEAIARRYRITSVMLVPSMVYALLDHPDFATTDLSSLETVFYRRVADVAGETSRAVGENGADLLPVLRADRSTTDSLRAPQRGARSR